MSKTMEQLTAAHTGKVLQECKNLYLHLKDEGRTMDEFVEYLENIDFHRRQEEDKYRRTLSKMDKCPKCGAYMYLYAVNDTPRTQVGGDWKSQWICPNPKCGHDELSMIDPKEKMAEIRKEMEIEIIPVVQGELIEQNMKEVKKLNLEEKFMKEIEEENKDG